MGKEENFSYEEHLFLGPWVTSGGFVVGMEEEAQLAGIR